jgi:hypothetical protein
MIRSRTMRLEIVTQLATFKNSLIYDNRFFSANDPFLLAFKKHIELDSERECPVMISAVSKGSILYRARIMDSHLSGDAYIVTKMMEQHGNELNMVECCEKCDDVETCESVKGSAETVEKFRESAKDAYLKIAPPSEPNFNGFDKKGSSLPPKENYNSISDMRANPKYIRYLYAANDKYTALLEARSNINSLVSVSNIEILETLRILDISDFTKCPPDDDDLFDLLYALNDEFSTPVSGELKDYLATQVISEFVKCLDFIPKFDGICFRSSLNPKGKNYTIFSESKYRPVSSDVYYIHEIGLTAYGVTGASSVEINSENPNPY